MPAPPPPPVKLPTHEPVDVGTQTTPSLADMEPILPIRHRRTKEEREFDRKMLVRRQRRDARRKLKPGEQLPVWVCQFCEFEDVFGYAPLAVISGYEERVRRARRVALERKRLLEKARTRGKKKKSVAANKHQAAKQAAAAAANTSTTTPATSQQRNVGTTSSVGVDATVLTDSPGEAPTAQLPQPPLHYDKSIGPGGCTCCTDHNHNHNHAEPVP